MTRFRIYLKLHACLPALIRAAWTQDEDLKRTVVARIDALHIQLGHPAPDERR